MSGRGTKLDFTGYPSIEAKRAYFAAASRRSRKHAKETVAELARVEAARLELVERVIRLGLRRRSSASALSFVSLSRMIAAHEQQQSPRRTEGDALAQLGGDK